MKELSLKIALLKFPTVALIAAAVLLSGCKQNRGATRQPSAATHSTAPTPRPEAHGQSLAQQRPLGPIRFTDITAQAGIHFIHNSGAFGKKYLPETMGSGVCFIDYDNDGWQDILFVNSMD